MRGSPLLRALFAFLAIGALGWPLWHLTRPGEVKVTMIEASPANTKAIRLQLTFTSLPTKFIVRHLGKDVWDEVAPQPEMEREIPLAYSEKGVELVFEIDWPPNAPLSAARIVLTDPAGESHERSLWGRGRAEEVLSFP